MLSKRRQGEKNRRSDGIYPLRSNCQMRLASLVTCTQIMAIEWIVKVRKTPIYGGSMRIRETVFTTRHLIINSKKVGGLRTILPKKCLNELGQARIEWVFKKNLVVFHWIDSPKNSQIFVENTHYPIATPKKIFLIRTHPMPACIGPHLITFATVTAI